MQTLSSDAWGTKPDIHGFTLVHAIPTIASVSFPKHRFAIKAWSYTLIACLHYFQLSAVNPFILHLLVTVCGPSLRPPSSVSAQSMHQTWPWHTPCIQTQWWRFSPGSSTTDPRRSAKPEQTCWLPQTAPL